MSGASFSNINLEAPQSAYGKYLDKICPYYLMFGMTWDEFWYESLERLPIYWQKNQYEIERKNQELWWQGAYIKKAIEAVFDMKHQAKYPDKPQRITEMTEDEKQAENDRRLAQMRNILDEHKRRWDAKHPKGVDTA